MLNIVALFLLFGITLGAYAPNYDLENADQYFNEFIQNYEKNYENAKEHRMRFEIFKRNLKQYNEWNDYYQHEKGGHMITRFADEEGHQSCLNVSQKRNPTSPIQVKKEFLLNLPDYVDYREQNLVTGVKDQANCGSCYAFAAIANIESMYAKKTGHLLSLSEQQPLDCVEGNCLGGDPLNVPLGLAEQGGSETEDDYPYEAEKKTCRTDQIKIKVKVIEGHEINTPDVESLKAALVQNGAPLAITLYATRTMMSAVGFVILNPDGSRFYFFYRLQNRRFSICRNLLCFMSVPRLLGRYLHRFGKLFLYLKGASEVIMWSLGRRRRNQVNSSNKAKY